MLNAAHAATRFAALLKAGASLRFLFIPQGYDDTTGTVRTFYFCDPGSQRAYATRPDETPANAIFHPVLRSGASIAYSQSMIGSRDTAEGVRLGGRSYPGRITIEIDNPGKFNFLKDVSFDGYPALILVGGMDFAFAEHQPFARVMIEGPARFEEDRIVFDCADLQEALNVDLQDNLFLGTGGVEGGSDLQGKPKPRLFGIRRNFQPVALGLVRIGTAVSMPGYVFNDRAVAEYDATVHRLRVAGVLMPYSGTFPPPQGFWSFDSETSLTLVNGPVPGVVTMDALGDASAEFDSEADLHALLSMGTGVPGPLPVDGEDPDLGDPFVLAAILGTLIPAPPDTDGYVDTLADIARRIAVTDGGISLTAVDHEAIALCRAQMPYPVGLYVPEGGNRLDLLDGLASPLGAWYGAWRDGLFQVSILAAPEAIDRGYLENLLAIGSGLLAPDVDLAAEDPMVLATLLGVPFDPDIAQVALELHPGNVQAPPKRLPTVAPSYRLTLGYQQNLTIQDASQLADIYDDAVTNPGFATDSDWTKGTGWTISGGKAHAAAGTASDLEADPALTLAEGDDWVAVVTVEVTADYFEVVVDGVVLEDVEGRTQLDASGTYRFEFVASGTLAQTLAIRKTAATIGTVDEVHVVLKRIEFVSQAFRTVVAEDPSIRVKHRRSKPLRIDTPLDRRDDAVAEAARQLALYGKRPDGSDREFWQVPAGVQPMGLNLGDIVRLTWPGLGLEAGRRLRLVQLDEAAATGTAELVLWG